jgi:hypothetical protein
MAAATRVAGEQMARATKRGMGAMTRSGGTGVAMTHLCAPHDNDPTTTVMATMTTTGIVGHSNQQLACCEGRCLKSS